MTKSNSLYVILISIYAFLINWISGNVGVMPIDTFAFFDTSYSILEGKYPIRDFWIFSGLLLDYLQALFFILIGENWTAYVVHGCFFNILISLAIYFTFINLNLSKIYSFFYSISLATLCYPVSGTPFAYQHSFVLSLISIFIICLAIKKESNILWLFLPIIMSLGFLSQQTPSSYINLFLIIIIFYNFISKKNIKNFKFFIFGCLATLLLFLAFLFITKTPVRDFIFQYILFPLTIGSGRILDDSSAFTSLSNQLNINRLIGDFKFIHVFSLLLITITLKNIFNKSNKSKNYLILLNLLILISTFIFIFHQLITANQIFIFGLIPIIAGFFQINLTASENKKKFLNLFLIVLVTFCTVKYHYRFNIERKFMDLENVNLEKAIFASQLSPKLENLKWITPFSYSENPQEELDFLKTVINHLKEDTRKKTVITHYQFLSLILGEDLNILNRWYMDHHSHPTPGHKYFKYYEDFVNKQLTKNNIEVIYLISFTKNEMMFDKVKVYFTQKCFKNSEVIEGKFSFHEIKNCS